MKLPINIILQYTFLHGQQKLYEVKYETTKEKKYLEVANEFQKTLEAFEGMRKIIEEQNNEIKKMKKSL